MTIARKFTMYFRCRVFMSLTSRRFRIKSPKIICDTICHNGADPFAVLVAPIDAFITRLWMQITSIPITLRVGHFSQIAPPIIMRIAIYVVNLICWPCASLIGPDKSMLKNQIVIKTHDASFLNRRIWPRSGFLDVTSNIPGMNFMRSCFSPSEFASHWIIRKIFVKNLWINIWILWHMGYIIPRPLGYQYV